MSRLLLVLLAVVFAPAASAASLSSSTQQRVLASTFEVVQLKPDEGAVAYERPLPLELIPYQQRVDKYRSIGTAFALGKNRYATAAHVFVVGMGSQFGPPVLRDAAGEVYAIDRVLKYSQEQDFVEFSLQHEPKKVQFLVVGGTVAVNDPVFAVGNALGQGVVIRDGVFTSETPEERAGRWKWLRFTAAASPGNSGGPLIDKDGRVIGIVLRKSGSENLNYAGPIGLIAAAPEKEGILDEQEVLRLPIMDAAETLETSDRIPLPASVADFYSAVRKITLANVVKGDKQYLDHNKERLFPNGPSSDELLLQGLRAPFPHRIQERQDRRWVATVPKDIQTAQLDNNGAVLSGAGMFRLRAPDDLKLATLYGDSKLFMDLMLRSGFAIHRQVGSDSIKLTSIGKARAESTNTDSYGRTWLVKIWDIPFLDLSVVTFSLPTPEGYVSLFNTAPTGLQDVVVHQQELLTDFIYVTFEAKLSRWQEFLALKQAQPQVFSKFSFEIDPDYKHVRIQSKRFELALASDVVPLSADSVLSLGFTFFRDDAAVVWDVGGMSLGEGSQKPNFLEIHRMGRPGASLPEGMQSAWTKANAGEFPYNGTASDVSGGMRIGVAAGIGASGTGAGGTTGKVAGGATGGLGSGAGGATAGSGAGAAGAGSAQAGGAAAAGGATAGSGANGSGSNQDAVRYVLFVQNEGSPGQGVMHTKLEALQKSFKALEH